MATIAIIAIGSRGDVAPLTGVGVRLQQAGHRVIMVAYQAFAEMVTGCGLEFRGLDDGTADLSDVSARRAAQAMAASPLPTRHRGLGDAVLAAVQAEPIDLVLLSPFAELAGHPLAEALGIPGIGLRLQPFSATAHYPPAVLGAWSAGRHGNVAASRFGESMIDMLYGKTVNRLSCAARATEGLGPDTGTPAHRSWVADPVRLFVRCAPQAVRLETRNRCRRLLVAGAPVRMATAGRSGGVPRRRSATGGRRLRQHGQQQRRRPQAVHPCRSGSSARRYSRGDPMRLGRTRCRRG